MQLFIFLSRYLAFISNVIFDGERSLKLRSTPSRLRFAHRLPIPLPPPSPSPPTSPSSSRRNPEMSPSPLLRDVGSSSGIPNSLGNANPAASSPFQRDVDGSSSLDGGMREVDTRGGTQGMGGPASASRKRTTMNVVVRFLHFFVHSIELTVPPPNASKHEPRHLSWFVLAIPYSSHPTDHPRSLRRRTSTTHWTAPEPSSPPLSRDVGSTTRTPNGIVVNDDEGITTLA